VGLRADDLATDLCGLAAFAATRLAAAFLSLVPAGARCFFFLAISSTAYCWFETPC
jgi:hypothetical protein